MTVELYQNSDNAIRVPVVDGVTGDTYLASSFSDAEYIIADNAGKIVIHKKLNNGIIIDGDDFLINIDDGELLVKGNYLHQLVVWNSAGDKLPPVFIDKVKILQVIMSPV